MQLAVTLSLESDVNAWRERTLAQTWGKPWS
jgi:hypothetical protein